MEQAKIRLMKQYRGYRDENGDARVFRIENGVETPLPLRLDLRNHSPTGFQFGYNGSGPAQLALAMLADYAGDATAQKYYQDFKFKVIGRLPQDQPFTITGQQIDAALKEITQSQGR